MPRISFLVLFNILVCYGLFAQDIQQIKEYADQQFNRGNHSIALKEYQRILLFDEHRIYDDTYARIASLYYSLEDYENAQVYYDFAWKAISNDSLKLEFAFKKTLCFYKLDKYLLGLSELFDLPESLSPYFERKKNLYLAICYFGLEDHAESLNYFAEIVDSSGLERIDSVLVQLNKYSKKYDPDKLEIMSIFLPGLGQAYAGEIGSAANSIFLLSGIAAYSYHTMLTYTFLDGALVMATWFYRYYTGGHRLAYAIGEGLLAEKRKDTYLQILGFIGQASEHH